MSATPFKPDPKLQLVIDSILAEAPEGFVEWRRTQLEDEEWRDWRRTHHREVLDYFDPKDLRRQVQWYIDMLNPFSERNIRIKRFCEAAKSGGRMTMSKINTSEIVATWDRSPDPNGSPERN